VGSDTHQGALPIEISALVLSEVISM